MLFAFHCLESLESLDEIETKLSQLMVRMDHKLNFLNTVSKR